MAEPSASAKSEQTITTEGALVHGSLWKAIWTMSWPLLLTTISTSVIGLVDMKVAGTLSSASQAAVGVSEQILFLFMVFIMSVGVGTTALVSRAAGAGDTAQAADCAGQSIGLSLCMGIALSLLSLSCAGFGLHLFSQAHDATDLAREYLGIYSFYLIPFSVTAIVNSSFRAIGDAKTPLLIVACMTTLNILGDYCTVILNWPLSGLGLRGIALSGVLANSLGATMGLILLSRSSLRGCFKSIWPVRLERAEHVLKVGIPSGLQRLGWSLSVFVLFHILAQCPSPTHAIAAWTIGMRVEALLFMPLMALSLAVSSIVGQNLGGQRPDRAISAGWKVATIGMILMVVLGSLLFIFAHDLASAMTTDPIAIKYTVGYLQTNAITEPLLALTMILGGALQGAGDTRTPMLITVASHWIVRLPVAWFLALKLGWGPNGAWASMAVSSMVSASLTTWRFQSKAWIKTKL